MRLYKMICHKIVKLSSSKNTEAQKNLLFSVVNSGNTMKKTRKKNIYTTTL